MAPRVIKRNLKGFGFIEEADGTMRVIRKVKSPTGKVRVVSKRCGKKCPPITFNSLIHKGTYKKRATKNYYPPTKCSMKKVSGAKTKTGRKCVGSGRSTANQIAARRAYNRKAAKKSPSPSPKKANSPKKAASPKKANSPKNAQGMMARFTNIMRRGGRARRAPNKFVPG